MGKPIGEGQILCFLYPLGDRVPGVFGQEQNNYRAKYSGEFRPPNKGEWYLSGSIVAAYRAPNDLNTPFHIAILVKVRRVEYWEEVK